ALRLKSYRANVFSCHNLRVESTPHEEIGYPHAKLVFIRRHAKPDIEDHFCCLWKSTSIASNHWLPACMGLKYLGNEHCSASFLQQSAACERDHRRSDIQDISQ
ncbi:hypothetical protein WG66_009668, partial [Moniliophthora roreri]